MKPSREDGPTPRKSSLVHLTLLGASAFVFGMALPDEWVAGYDSYLTKQECENKHPGGNCEAVADASQGSATTTYRHYYRNYNMFNHFWSWGSTGGSARSSGGTEASHASARGGFGGSAHAHSGGS